MAHVYFAHHFLYQRTQEVKFLLGSLAYDASNHLVTS